MEPMKLYSSSEPIESKNDEKEQDKGIIKKLTEYDARIRKINTIPINNLNHDNE